MELINYIDFTSICEDHNLTTGDMSFDEQQQLENIIQNFINNNKIILQTKYDMYWIIIM